MSVSRKSPDGLRRFITQVSRIRRLSQDEVIYFAHQAQQMKHLLKLKSELREKLKQEPTLEQWSQVANLSESSLNTVLLVGQQAKHTIMEAHLYLTIIIARKYQHRGVELLDLIQVGTEGLSRGLEKFDPTKGSQFSTYAYWWIRKAVKHTIALQHRKNGMVVGIDYSHLLDQLESDLPLPEEMVARKERREWVKQNVNKLPLRQRDVLILFYGLQNEPSYSFGKIASKLNLSYDQVRYSHNQGLKTLETYFTVEFVKID